jgi:photosystem II stability/assembly factor-like uncharacterized protein
MKTLNYFLIVALLSLTYNICSAATIWSDRGFPPMKIAITAVASQGDNIYAGTNRNGFFYTTDNGREWNTVNRTFDNVNINSIITFGKQSVLAFSDDEIFKSDNDGSSWEKIDFFQKNEEKIQCHFITNSGKILIGTNRNIWLSDDNAKSWTSITGSLLSMNPDVLAITANSKDEIFISVANGDRGDIYRLIGIGSRWYAKHEGIQGSYKTDNLVCNSDNILYGIFGNDIYYSDDNGDSWKIKDKPIKDYFISNIKLTDRGDLVVSQDQFVSIWDNAAGEWIFDNPEIDLPSENGNLEISKDGYGIVFASNKLYKSKKEISSIIKDINFIYTVTLYDANNIAIPDKSFQIIKNGLSIGQVTTNESGKFTTKDFSIGAGDEIKLSRMLNAVTAIKPNRSSQGNTLYMRMIDNSKIDENGVQSDFKLGGDFYPDITMDHTTLKFNIVVSLNWDASQTYLDSLQTWLRYLANYYYDVSDGQMCFHQIDIYDNKVMWDQSDVKIFASNMVWPNANIHCIYELGGHAHMPRKWYGGSDDTRNITAENNWMNVLNQYNYRTLGHELGHYLYGFLDEYLYTNESLKNMLPNGYNYGYMQYQYWGGYSSEMSSMEKYPNSNYEITHQYYYNGSDCWTQFENEYEGTFAGVFSQIYKPTERYLGTRDYLKGPNSNIWDLDYDVGKDIVFRVNNVENSAGEVNLRVQVDGQYYGELPIMLFKKSGATYRRLDQGKNADNGKIRILGANVGDFVAINYYKYGPAEVWSLSHDITSVSKADDGEKADKLLTDEVSLKKVDGNYVLENSFEFNENGDFIFQTKPNIEFSQEPQMQLEMDERGIKQEELPFDKTSESYKFTFESMNNEGIFDIIAYDKSKNPFYIPFTYRIADDIGVCYSYNGDALLKMDEINRESVDRLMICSTPFHVPLDGLPEGSVRSSDIFYISTYRNDIDPKSDNKLALYYSPSMFADSRYSDLGIFKWDEKSSQWDLIGGEMDTTMKVCYASINSGGCYGLFTYDKPNSVPNIYDRGSLELKVSPNPANDIATLSYYLIAEQYVNISLSNAYGSEIKVVADTELIDKGNHRIDIPTGQLTSGIYYITVKAGYISETIGFVVIR